jgi:hypothetical protein
MKFLLLIMLAYKLTDGATPQLQRLAALLTTTQSGMVGGRAVVNYLRDWFAILDKDRPNKMGGQRTHFWAQVRRSVQQPQQQRGGVFVAINHVGAAQRYFGGIIRAVTTHFLTIPAHPDYYGKSAREFDSLRFAVLPRGGPALIEAERTGISIGKARKDGTRSVKARETKIGAVAYWLRTSVEQDADPSVLPPEEELARNAANSVESWAQRQAERGGAA